MIRLMRYGQVSLRRCVRLDEGESVGGRELCALQLGLVRR